MDDEYETEYCSYWKYTKNVNVTFWGLANQCQLLNVHNHNKRVIFSHELKLEESFIKVAEGVDLTF